MSHSVTALVFPHFYFAFHGVGVHKNSLAKNSSQPILPIPFHTIASTSNPVSTITCIPQGQSIAGLLHLPEEKSALLPCEDSVKTDFEGTINRLIKDVYSDVEIPFKPLENKKTIPEWIFLQHTVDQGEG